MSLLRQHFSSDRAREELGYTNRPLEDTVDHAWGWFVDNGYAKARPSSARLVT